MPKAKTMNQTEAMPASEQFLTVKLSLTGKSIGKIIAKTDLPLNKTIVNTVWYYVESNKNQTPYLLTIEGIKPGSIIDESVAGKHYQFTMPVAYWLKFIEIQDILVKINQELTLKKGQDTSWIREKKLVEIKAKKK